MGDGEGGVHYAYYQQGYPYHHIAPHYYQQQQQQQHNHPYEAGNNQIATDGSGRVVDPSSYISNAGNASVNPSGGGFGHTVDYSGMEALSHAAGAATFNAAPDSSMHPEMYFRAFSSSASNSSNFGAPIDTHIISAPGAGSGMSAGGGKNKIEESRKEKREAAVVKVELNGPLSVVASNHDQSLGVVGGSNSECFLFVVVFFFWVLPSSGNEIGSWLTWCILISYFFFRIVIHQR
jgi:hypothetical protein